MDPPSKGNTTDFEQLTWELDALLCTFKRSCSSKNSSLELIKISILFVYANHLTDFGAEDCRSELNLLALRQ